VGLLPVLPVLPVERMRLMHARPPPDVAQVEAYHQALLARPSVQSSIQPPSKMGTYTQQLVEFYRGWLADRGL
jgi:hypothetical protein